LFCPPFPQEKGHTEKTAHNFYNLFTFAPSPMPSWLPTNFKPGCEEIARICVSVSSDTPLLVFMFIFDML
jgi:hypothetical protein